LPIFCAGPAFRASSGNPQGISPTLTSAENVFAAGDMERGQSLVIWAIVGGRHAGHHIDKHLMGRTFLPR
jgi:glutamate synthase (NADPH/NADH) small chain